MENPVKITDELFRGFMAGAGLPEPKTEVPMSEHWDEGGASLRTQLVKVYRELGEEKARSRALFLSRNNARLAAGTFFALLVLAILAKI